MSHHPTNRRSFVARPAVALGLATALALGGCADDEPEAASPDPAQAREGQAFCDSYLAISTDQGPDVDWETATDEEVGEAMAAYATAFVPKLEALEAAATDETADAVDTYTGTYREILETGDDAAFDDDYLTAENVIVDAAIESCAVDVIDATAIDYAYQGIPDSVTTGRIGFRLANEGVDVHEAVILRRLDDDTTPASEILALTEEEQTELVEFVGVAFVAPGSEGAVLLDVTPGDYLVICNLPVGMTDMESGADGPPHHAEGMIGEFSVA